MRRKVETEPPLVRQLRPDAPPGMEAIVYRALRRRPSERYPTIADLAYDLGHLDSVPIPAEYLHHEPPPHPLGDLPPWRTTLTVLGIILLILLLAGSAAQFAHHVPVTH
jgi:hypothetical protein